MKFFQFMQNVDRRFIFILIALAIILPFLTVFDQPIQTTEPVENIYQMIDSFAGRDDRAVLLDFYHDPSTMPELFPMEVSIIRHCFLRDVKVFMLSFNPQTAPLIDLAISKVKSEPEFANVKSGEHYLNLGYKPIALYLPLVLGMGDDIPKAMGTDAEGRNVSSLPIIEGIKNYNEMNLIMEFSGSDHGTSWIYYARARFGANVAAGVTAVIAADAYPFIQTGQLVGILGGLKGAAEYEKLVDVFADNRKRDSEGKVIVDANGVPILQPRAFSREIARTEQVSISDPELPYDFKMARIGMNAQTVAHVVIILFIIFGNIGYFVMKRNEKKQ